MSGMDGDLTGGGPRTDQGIASGDILRYISAGAGLLMLLGGLYLGFVTFTEVRSLLHDPAPLQKWAQLRDVVHPEQKKVPAPAAKSPSTSGVAPGIAPKKAKKPGYVTRREHTEKQFRVLGGYGLLFLGLLFTWILAKIAAMFVVHGTNILLKASGRK